MHIVEGRACSACSEPIEVAKKALACEACAKQFHKRCLQDKRSCPDCGTDLVGAALERARRLEADAQLAATRGRTVLWLVTLLGGSIPFGLAALAVASGSVELAYLMFRPVLVMGVLLAAIHRGSVGYARGLRAIAGIGGVLGVGLGIAYFEESPIVAVLMVLAGIDYLVVAIVMATSTTFWLYLSALHEEHHGPDRHR